MRSVIDTTILLPMTHDNESPVQLANQRLRDATRRVQQAMAAIATTPDQDEWRAALVERLDAEREVARLAGDEYAVELDLGAAWDTGAPLPHLIASERRTFLVFYLRDPVPGWDSSWVQVVDPAAAHPVPLGVAEFVNVHAVKLGGPNDEAIEGHPLHGKGLAPYGAHRVINSRWIFEQERINSVHPMHRAG